MRSFQRQKAIICGPLYREVDIFPYTETQTITAKCGRRAPRERVTAPKQRDLNDKNARRYLVQLGNMNFGEGDHHITQTYSKKNTPPTVEAAEKEADNYLRRVAYRRKKEGLPPLKYILVTAYSFGKDGEKPVRIHHHIIMNGGLDRDTLEDLWRRRRKKGQKKGEKIGYCNADNLQPDENGIAALATYLAKQPGGKKRWSTSQNLKRPYTRNNDTRYTRRQVERLAKNPPGREFWEKQYPGWTLTDNDNGFQAVFNPVTGWAIYLKLRRRE